MFSDVIFHYHASTVLYAVPFWYDMFWISLIYRCSYNHHNCSPMATFSQQVPDGCTAYFMRHRLPCLVHSPLQQFDVLYLLVPLRNPWIMSEKKRRGKASDNGIERQFITLHMKSLHPSIDANTTAPGIAEPTIKSIQTRICLFLFIACRPLIHWYSCRHINHVCPKPNDAARAQTSGTHLETWPFSVTFKVGPGAHGLAALGYILAPCLARLALVPRPSGCPAYASSFQGNPCLSIAILALEYVNN